MPGANQHDDGMGDHAKNLNHYDQYLLGPAIMICIAKNHMQS
jgi:hypothetical protein